MGKVGRGEGKAVEGRGGFWRVWERWGSREEVSGRRSGMVYGCRMWSISIFPMLFAEA